MVYEERYEVMSQIGAGGMSQVYRVWDHRLQKEWALKKTIADTPEKRQAFVRESMLLKQTTHPGIPFLVDSFEEGEACFIVMEYIRGESLKQYLNRKRNMPVRQTLQVMDTILDTLSYLHRLPVPVVYSDLKPANIMLQKEFGGKLIDFGSVRSGTEAAQMGTLEYAAPEQLVKTANSIVDPRSDIYSFGVVCYEMLTGDKFNGNYLENPFIPEYLRNVLFQCTRSSRKKRFQTMEEVREAINKGQQRKTGWHWPAKRREPFLLQELERVILYDLQERNEEG